jgi:hypothetical protein
MLERIVSGGQTGVDRAALDVALALRIPCGGWCPRGRRAEDGPLPPIYPLAETPVDAYPQRTEWNVRDSAGTLILTRGQPDRGTALTLRLAREHRKPVYCIDLQTPDFFEAVWAWLETHAIDVLNVAGPRESSQPGVYADAAGFLYDLLTVCAPAD